MILDKYTQFKPHTIWEPVYSDKAVMLIVYKVGEHNKITFTGNPKTGYNAMGEDPYYVSGKVVRRYKKKSNGTTMCYVVPLARLEPLEISENSVLDF